ncbi:flavin reductase [Nocardioides humi]|uniref:flavin reductase n=1 Tax=Nocardioides humi TaxID=449461 RepID=UPI001128B901|nr:flavin reductase [Nocardioides humi]
MQSGELAAVDAERFRRVMGHYPTGVAVVTTTGADGQPIGMVVGSFTSVSLDPPLVAFLPDKGSSTYGRMGMPGRFVVNVLGAEHEALCRRFAGKVEAEKWSGVRWRPSASGEPILDAAVAWVECALHTVYDGGDHDIVVGRVTSMDVGDPAMPLLFFQGGYGRFSPLSLMAPADDDLLKHVRIANIVRPLMERLAEELGVECVAQCVVNDDLVSIANASPPGSVLAPSRVGARLPWVPPYGSLYVAWSGPDAIERWIGKATRERDVSRAHLLESLERVRERGWSLGLVAEVHREVDQTLAELSQGGYGSDAQRRLSSLLQEVGDLYEPQDLAPAEEHLVRSIGAPVFGPGARWSWR